MKYKSVFIAIALAIMASMGASVKADDVEDLLNQLATSSKGDTTKSDNSSDSEASLIKKLLAYYRECLQQIESLENETNGTVTKAADQNTPTQPDPAQAAVPAAPSTQPPASLQTGQVQSSGPLKEVHLAGYPALPNVVPTSSVTNPTAAQLEEKAETDQEQAKIKRLLFERWDNPQN